MGNVANLRMSDIGKPLREWDVHPVEWPQPQPMPQPVPAPAEPEPVERS